MATKWHEEFDTVVLGSGISGLATAIAAQKHCLRTLLIEKAGLLGGGTCYSAALIWIGRSHLAKAAGVKDSREAVHEYMSFMSGGQAVAENMDTLIDVSPKALKFFENCGIRFRLVKGVPDHYVGMAPSALTYGRSIEADLVSGNALGRWQNCVLTPKNSPYRMLAEELVAWGGFSNQSNWDPALMHERELADMRGVGVGIITNFLRAALAAGVTIRTGQTTRELIAEGGRVTGIALAGKGTASRSIRARRGVVISTGGYESNPAMVGGFEGLPGLQSMYPASMTGDGMVLGTSVGGAIHVIQNHMQLFLAYNVPVGTKPGEHELRLAGIIELCSPNTIVVNKSGQRFADESYFQKMAPKLREFNVETHQYPNLPCFLVFDQQFADNYSFAGRPAGSPIPRWVKRSDTTEGLARSLGIDVKALGKTVRRFNGFVKNGRDEDFGRGELKWTLAREKRGRAPRSLGTLQRAPFYGIELSPTVAGSAGLLTSRHAQVLRFDREPIPGLYAVGNSAARIEYGSGYQAGLTMASGMTFGLMAGMHMKKSAGR